MNSVTLVLVAVVTISEFWGMAGLKFRSIIKIIFITSDSIILLLIIDQKCNKILTSKNEIQIDQEYSQRTFE